MSPFQIVAIVILGLGVLTALGFTVAFIVVSCAKEKTENNNEDSLNSQKEEINEIDLDQMLAKLDEASKNKEKEEEKQAEEEKVEEPIAEPVIIEPATEEAKEEPAEEKEEKVEEVVEPVVVEDKKEEEKPAVDASKVIINIYGADAQKQEEKEETPVAIEETKEVPADHTGPEFDYRIRLEKIKESQAKIDRDLDKTSRAILKYERTIRRMERNQKMLDRRALELTNLNLLMYSVTDIKNVDAEKKARQEELTAHIAELKASIQDAQEYIEANREKYESNLKLKDYLVHEQTRYADEVKELEALIAAGKFFDDGTETVGDNQ